jgi:hypothetical protein
MKDIMRISLVSTLLALAACGEVVGPEASGGGAAPTIASVSPDHGPVIGGAEVSITGTNFQADGAGDAFVVVDGFLAPTATVVDGSTVTFELPAGVQEGDSVDVTVFNGNGQATLEDAFRYNERPRVISIDPPRGRGTGGNVVTIIGRGFEELEAGDPTVTIDGVAATSVTVVDDTTITATTGDNTTSLPFAPLDVVVSNANGSNTLEASYQVTLPGILVLQRQGTLIYYFHPPTDTLIEIARASSSTGHTCTRNGNSSSLLIARLKPSASDTGELASLDPLSGTITAVGDTTDGANKRIVTTIAFNGTTLYGHANRIARNTQTPTFLTINPTTGATTPVVASVGTTPRAIFAKDGSSFWLVDNLNETLDTITTAGGISAGPALTGAPGANRVHGMVVFDGVLYVSDTGGRIWTVNTTTGAVSEAGVVPFGIGGICETPATF